MSQILEVLLTDAEEWPQHYYRKAWNSREFPWRIYRGRLIKIGPPEKPRRGVWKCDTDFVWPVDNEFLIELGLENSPVYVCRHQIQIGD